MNKKLPKSKNNRSKNLQSHSLHSYIHWIILVIVMLAFFLFFKSYVLATTDTEYPAVSVVYPASKTRISPNSKVNISASATDNIGVSQVEIYAAKVNKLPLPGRKVSIETVTRCTFNAMPYVCVWNVPGQSNVTYLVQAIATDTSGNVSISKYVEFTVR